MSARVVRLLRMPWSSSSTRLPAFGRVAWLTLVWVLLWGTFSWANLLGGLAVVLVVLWLFPLPHVVGHHRLRLGGLLRAAGAVAVDLVASSLRVAGQSLRPGPIRSSIVEVRIEGSELLLAVAVEALSLVPGSVVIDASPEDGLLHAHVLGADDDAAVEDYRREVARLERRLAAAGFGPVAVETVPAGEGR